VKPAELCKCYHIWSTCFVCGIVLAKYELGDIRPELKLTVEMSAQKWKMHAWGIRNQHRVGRPDKLDR
jgi:hypothetical protein